jgi:hypothetical protein
MTRFNDYNESSTTAKSISIILIVLSVVYSLFPNIPFPLDDITLFIAAVSNAGYHLLNPQQIILKKVMDVLRKILFVIYIAIIVLGGLILLITLHFAGVDFKNALWIYVFILAALLFIGRLFQNKLVGWIGEVYSASCIRMITGGVVLKDVYIEGSSNVVQIDIIAITEKGVLVIEKKTMIGLILGDEYQKQWTISLKKGKLKYPMKNPLHQNYGHIKVLEEKFPEYKDFFINLVVFGNNAKLGNKIPDNVITDRQFFKYYRSLPNRMSSSLQEDFTSLLTGLSKNREEVKRKHKNKIKQYK